LESQITNSTLTKTTQRSLPEKTEYFKATSSDLSELSSLVSSCIKDFLYLYLETKSGD